MDESPTKLYPGWKNAVQIIREMVKEKGYGFIIPMNDLLDMMDLEEPKGNITYEQSKKFQLKLLNHINQLTTTLLECHQICLDNIRGEGYQVLTPKNQVVYAPYKHIRSAKKELGKARTKLNNVALTELDNETKKERYRMLARLNFIETSFNDKQLPNDDDNNGNLLPIAKN